MADLKALHLLRWLTQMLVLPGPLVRVTVLLILIRQYELNETSFPSGDVTRARKTLLKLLQQDVTHNVLVNPHMVDSKQFHFSS